MPASRRRRVFVYLLSKLRRAGASRNVVRAAVVTLTAGLAVVPATRPATAQVNIEAQRSMDPGTRAAFDATFRLARGNSDLYDLGGSVRVDHRTGDTYFLGLARVLYGENNGTTYRNRSFAHVRLTHYFSEVFAVESFVQLERDGFTLLNLRSLGGAGVRIASLRREDVAVYHGSALMLENERLDEERVVVHPAQTTALRWTNYLSLGISISESADFVVIGYLQPRLDRFSDMRILSDAELEVSISRSVSLTTAVHVRYDSRPPDGIETYDFVLSNGLRWRL